MFPISLPASGPGYTGFFTDMTTTFWSAMLRINEALVAAAPMLVAGVITAGMLRGLVGADRIRRILDVDRWSGPLRAWALGVLLPVDSLGALPVARELRRAGIPSGTVLSFVLIAPVLNPISIIFGLSYVAPEMLLYFAAGTFMVSVGIGVLWNRIISDQRDRQPEQLETAPRSSLVRLRISAQQACLSLVGPVFFDCLLALLAVGLLGAFLPYGILQTGMTRDNPFAPIIMGAVAIPVYVTPVDVMMHFGLIVQDGYSLGAAFALILLGAGANVGVANWLRRDYGFRSLALFIVLLLGSTLVIGLTADRTIIHGEATVEDHTHAFDSFTRLSRVDPDKAGWSWLWDTLRRGMRADETVGLVVLVLMFALGMFLKRTTVSTQIDELLSTPPVHEDGPETSGSGINAALTPKQLVLSGVVSVVAFAILGLYLFYPPADSLIGEINDIRADLYSAVDEGNVTEARRRIEQFRRQASKLPMCTRLRNGTVTPEQQSNLDDLLYSLDSLEAGLVEGSATESRILRKYVERVWMACRQSYRNPEAGIRRRS